MISPTVIMECGVRLTPDATRLYLTFLRGFHEFAKTHDPVRAENATFRVAFRNAKDIPVDASQRLSNTEVDVEHFKFPEKLWHSDTVFYTLTTRLHKRGGVSGAIAFYTLGVNDPKLPLRIALKCSNASNAFDGELAEVELDNARMLADDAQLDDSDSDASEAAPTPGATLTPTPGATSTPTPGATSTPRRGVTPTPAPTLTPGATPRPTSTSSRTGASPTPLSTPPFEPVFVVYPWYTLDETTDVLKERDDVAKWCYSLMPAYDGNATDFINKSVPAEVFRMLEESARNMHRLWDQNFAYMDFKADNVLYWRCHPLAATRFVLGDIGSVQLRQAFEEHQHLFAFTFIRPEDLPDVNDHRNQSTAGGARQQTSQEHIVWTLAIAALHMAGEDIVEYSDAAYHAAFQKAIATLKVDTPAAAPKAGKSRLNMLLAQGDDVTQKKAVETLRAAFMARAATLAKTSYFGTVVSQLAALSAHDDDTFERENAGRTLLDDAIRILADARAKTADVSMHDDGCLARIQPSTDGQVTVLFIYANGYTDVSPPFTREVAISKLGYMEHSRAPPDGHPAYERA